MSTKRNEATSTGMDEASKCKTLQKVYQSKLELSSKALSELRTVHNCQPSEIVSALRKYYPKFDRAMLSKAENADKWGMVIPSEVIRKVYQELVPDARIDFKVLDPHSLPRRISFRLTDSDFASLNLMKDEAGIDTMQEFMTVIVHHVMKEGI